LRVDTTNLVTSIQDTPKTTSLDGDVFYDIVEFHLELKTIENGPL
jgi:hypothetical protein